MISFKKITILLLLFCGILQACHEESSKPEDAIARVGDYYLSRSDIDGLVPENTGASDSLQIIQDYIDNWIRQKLVLRQAEKNLSKEQKDFSRQLGDYRNSLIIYTYQQELIRQSVDTVVTENEIVNYYNANKADFELKENIVKVLYVKLAKNSNKVQAFRQLLQSEREADRKKLLELSSRHAVNSFMDDQSWLIFNDILKEIPIKTYNQEEYLQNNRYIEIEDSTFKYLLNIKGFMIKESISPLSFETENIRSIIINKRKIKLIRDMEQSVYEDALKNGDFEVIR